MILRSRGSPHQPPSVRRPSSSVSPVYPSRVEFLTLMAAPPETRRLVKFRNYDSRLNLWMIADRTVSRPFPSQSPPGLVYSAFPHRAFFAVNRPPAGFLPEARAPHGAPRIGKSRGFGPLFTVYWRWFRVSRVSVFGFGLFLGDRGIYTR